MNNKFDIIFHKGVRLGAPERRRMMLGNVSISFRPYFSSVQIMDGTGVHKGRAKLSYQPSLHFEAHLFLFPSRAISHFVLYLLLLCFISDVCCRISLYYPDKLRNLLRCNAFSPPPIAPFNSNLLLSIFNLENQIICGDPQKSVQISTYKRANRREAGISHSKDTSRSHFGNCIAVSQLCSPRRFVHSWPVAIKDPTSFVVFLCTLLVFLSSLSLDILSGHYRASLLL